MSLTFFSKQPFLFLAISLALGIWLGNIFPSIWYVIVPLFGFVLYYRKSNILLLLSSIVLVFCVGVQLSKTLFRNQESVAESIYFQSLFLKGIVNDAENRGEGKKLKLKVLQSSKQELVDKEIYLTTKTHSDIEIGDVILYEGELSAFRKPSIPEQFDFQTYYRNRGIVAQAYPEAKALIKITHVNTWQFLIQKVRSHLENNLEKLLPPSKERAIIKSLVVGNRQDLDPDLKSTYIAAGVFHVLAVSGLHVGVIFILILFCIKNIQSKWVKIALLISSLIFYACLTGLSQSVLRATAMFLIFGFAQVLQKKTASINTLFASVFLILLFKPDFLFESGFQLSVSAVLGILLFYKPLNDLPKFENWFLKWLWSMLAVSMAAQSLTTPFILYYFHQFPTYFLFVNVVVVFLIQFVLVSGSIAAGFGDFYGIGEVFAKTAEFLCELTNECSYFTSSLPLSRITFIHLTDLQVVVFFMGIICFYWFWKFKQKVWFYANFVCFVLLSLSITQRFLHYKKQHYIAYHKVNNQLVIEYVNERNSRLYFDKEKLSESNLEVALGNYWAKRNISKMSYQEINTAFMLEGDVYQPKKHQKHHGFSHESKRWSFKLYRDQNLYFSNKDENSKLVNID